jgi:hypothetical protein
MVFFLFHDSFKLKPICTYSFYLQILSRIMSVCKYDLRGYCRNGNQCKFLHVNSHEPRVHDQNRMPEIFIMNIIQFSFD